MTSSSSGGQVCRSTDAMVCARKGPWSWAGMPSKPSRPGNSRQPNQVRIIGGENRRRVLHFPDAPGLRPTPDRVRETLFNWLGQDLSGRVCLDLFAGAGLSAVSQIRVAGGGAKGPLWRKIVASVLGNKRDPVRWPVQLALLPSAAWLLDAAAAAALPSTKH